MLKPPLQPMLLFPLERPFNSSDYLFEFKWDGYRCLLFLDNNYLYLQSRNKKDLKPLFPEFNEIPKYIKAKKVVLDGEICILNDNGKPVFEDLQRRIGSKKEATLIVWDILSLEDREIYLKPLQERKKYLAEKIIEGPLLLKSPFIEEQGERLYTLAQEQSLEGIVAKKKDSPYEFKRSRYWYKIKTWNFLEAVIGGFTSDLKSLVVGKRNNNQGLIYMGKVKSGLSKELSEKLFEILPLLRNPNSPFKDNPHLKNVVWVNPLIKCRIRYTELTRQHTFRHGYIVDLFLD